MRGMFASFRPSSPVYTMHELHGASPQWSSYHSDALSPLQPKVDGTLTLPLHDVMLSADDRRTDLHRENTPLTCPSASSSRPYSRLSPLPALAALPQQPPPTPTLFPHYIQHHRRQNVQHFFVSASSRDQPGPSTVNHGSPRIYSLESDSLSSFSPSQNGSINSNSNVHRTSPHPVFHTTSDLAAHHGIPQFLPPVPRTTRYTSAVSATPAPGSIPSSSSRTDFDFSAICSSYLTMLSQKPNEATSSVAPAIPISESSNEGAAVQALMEVLSASPEFRMANDFDDCFLTSPFDDSPFDDFLRTPAVDSSDVSESLDLTSPAIVDADDFEGVDGQSLFGGSSLLLTGAAYDPRKESARLSSYAIPAPSINLDELYQMPSPSTPALDPASLHPSPRVASTSPLATPAPSGRRNAPTGTRKNVTPESLVPIDAPIQPRKYVTPSATSRKEVPAGFAKKRQHSVAFGGEDEVDLSSLPESDMAAIEAKRRQNTLAARRSRKRKLEYQRELEITLEQERATKEMWMAKAMMYEALLLRNGLDVPPSA